MIEEPQITHLIVGSSLKAPAFNQLKDKKMTTRISIKKTDEVNHHDAMVDVLDHGGEITESHRVSDGEGETEFYIHGSQSLAVREVEKKSVDVDSEPNAEAAAIDESDESVEATD